MNCLVITPGERRLYSPAAFRPAFDRQAATFAEPVKAICTLDDRGQQGAVNANEATKAHAPRHNARSSDY